LEGTKQGTKRKEENDNGKELRKSKDHEVRSAMTKRCRCWEKGNGFQKEGRGERTSMAVGNPGKRKGKGSRDVYNNLKRNGDQEKRGGYRRVTVNSFQKKNLKSEI